MTAIEAACSTWRATSAICASTVARPSTWVWRQKPLVVPEATIARTDVFVTNGGYGGVQLALGRGIPLVVTGGKEDKPEVGARVAWTGAGIRFRQERPSPGGLRKAIRRVLDDERYRVEAQRLAADMARSPGAVGLADIVDSLSSARNAIG